MTLATQNQIELPYAWIPNSYAESLIANRYRYFCCRLNSQLITSQSISNTLYTKQVNGGDVHHTKERDLAFAYITKNPHDFVGLAGVGENFFQIIIEKIVTLMNNEEMRDLSLSYRNQIASILGDSINDYKTAGDMHILSEDAEGVVPCSPFFIMDDIESNIFEIAQRLKKEKVSFRDIYASTDPLKTLDFIYRMAIHGIPIRLIQDQMLDEYEDYERNILPYISEGVDISGILDVKLYGEHIAMEADEAPKIVKELTSEKDKNHTPEEILAMLWDGFPARQLERGARMT